MHQVYPGNVRRRAFVARTRNPFATVEIRNSEALNQRLLSALAGMSASLPGRVTNTPSGRLVFTNKWLSSPDLHRSDVPVFNELAVLIERLANRNVERKGTDRPLAIGSARATTGSTS